MAHAPAHPAEAPVDRGELVHPTVQALPVTPGKVAMWLFLATEIMFFTGLIGSYVVLRSGSPPTAYSELYPPATDLTQLTNAKGVVLRDIGPNRQQVAAHVRLAVSAGDGHLDALLQRQRRLGPGIRDRMDRRGGPGDRRDAGDARDQRRLADQVSVRAGA